MITKIRLRRMAKKKQPHYRLVVAGARTPRDGRFIEIIGYYNPRTDPPQVHVDMERALLWLRRGAQPTQTAKSVLRWTSVWEAFKPQAAPAAAGESAPPAE